MTTITIDDIRTELEAMQATEPATTFDLNRMYFGPVKVVYAVIGEKEGLSYAMEGGIFGIYESKDDAERVASHMTENWAIRREALRAMSDVELSHLSLDEWREMSEFLDQMVFSVKTLYINTPSVNSNNLPSSQVEWSYYE